MKYLIAVTASLVLALGYYQNCKMIKELKLKVRTLDVQYNYLVLELSMGSMKNWQGEYLIQRDIKLKEKSK